MSTRSGGRRCARGWPHPLVEPFRTSRFTAYDRVGERARPPSATEMGRALFVRELNQKLLAVEGLARPVQVVLLVVTAPGQARGAMPWRP